MFKIVVLISAFLFTTCTERPAFRGLGYCFSLCIFLFHTYLQESAGPRIRRPRPDGDIIGGVDEDISEFPYQVSLEKNGKHICGGAIVHLAFAITAAQCVDGVPKRKLRFRAGTSIRESGGSLHPVEDIWSNSKFDVLTMEYDEALIAVSKGFMFGESVLPIPFARSVPAPGTMAQVTGWGHASNQLQKVMMPIVDRQKCNKMHSMFGGITENMFCAGGEDSCVGEPGSPLVVEDELVGIVSWRLSCHMRGFPGVYTNMAVLSKQVEIKYLGPHLELN